MGRGFSIIAGCAALLIACEGERARPDAGSGSGRDASAAEDVGPDAASDAGAPADASLTDAVPGMDAGPAADAGPGMDAGPAADAGPGMDAGLAADAGPLDAAPPFDAGSAADAGSAFDAGAVSDGGFALDASRPDGTIAWPDGGFLNDGAIPDLGIPWPDGGILNDGSIPDFGVTWPDGGIPWPDGGILNDGGLPDVSLPDGGLGTVVQLGAASAYLNLQPPVAQDPLIVSFELVLDNPTGAPEPVTVTDVDLVGTAVQSAFRAEAPNGTNTYSAPPGRSTVQFRKVPNSGAPIGNLNMVCGSSALLVVTVQGTLPLVTVVPVPCVN